jgi:hypothetical protein
MGERRLVRAVYGTDRREAHRRRGRAGVAFRPQRGDSSRAAARTRDFTVGDWEDEDGLVSVAVIAATFLSRTAASGPDSLPRTGQRTPLLRPLR